MALPTDTSDPYEPGTGGATSTSPTTARGLAVRLPTGVKTISALIMRDAGNTPRTIKELWIRTNSGLKQVFAALAVNLSNLLVVGTRNSAGTVLVTSAAVTAGGAGGSPPYTYAWTRTDGGGHAWTITSPSSASTTFKTNVAYGTSESATFACTVTDAGGKTAVSDPVTATCGNG